MAADVFKLTRMSGEHKEVKLVLDNELWNKSVKEREALVLDCFNQTNKRWTYPFVRALFLKRISFSVNS